MILPQQSNINVIFVKFGNKYTPQQVTQLYDSLKRYSLGFKFYVYTDTGMNDVFEYPKELNIITPIKPSLPKWWNKLAMFSSNFPIKGKFVYFDIDTLIQGDPFYILSNTNWNKITLVDCHWKSKDIVRLTNLDVTINSSMMTFDNTNPTVNSVWDHFNNIGLRDYFLRKYVGIDRYLMHEPFDKEMFTTFPHDLILSYKYENHSKPAPVITCEELDFGSINFVPVPQIN